MRRLHCPSRGSPLPSEEELEQFGEQAHDRVWCNSVTASLQTELNRISHEESWEDRELVWRASMIHTIRSGEKCFENRLQ